MHSQGTENTYYPGVFSRGENVSVQTDWVIGYSAQNIQNSSSFLKNSHIQYNQNNRKLRNTNQLPKWECRSSSRNHNTCQTSGFQVNRILIIFVDAFPLINWFHIHLEKNKGVHKPPTKTTVRFSGVGCTKIRDSMNYEEALFQVMRSGWDSHSLKSVRELGSWFYGGHAG